MMHAPLQYFHVADDKEIPLAAMLRSVGDWCSYTYDLGDQWNHKIEVEEVVDEESSDVVLMDGTGA